METTAMESTPRPAAFASAGQPDPVIEAQSLTKYYGRDRGIEDVTFTVHRGEIFGLLGPNGSGKTTTLRVLLNFVRPTRGRVTVFGCEPWCWRAARDRQRIGYLPGELVLPEHDTGAWLLDFYAQLSRTPPVLRAEVCELLKLSASELRRPVRKYSRGQRQKLGLVQALQHNPELLLLDEPTTALDPLAQEALYRLLFELKQRGTTIVFSSHVLGEVLRLCDRVAVLKEGKLATVFEVSSFLLEAPRLVFLRFAEDAARVALAQVSWCEFVREEPPWSVYRVAPKDLPVLLQLLSRLAVADLRIESAAQQALLELYRSSSEGGA
ncbi:MAG: ABC transporter [Candidatus Sumerlaea sp.]|jgi:ABC-2 type transport system ATP-binding protein|uniref:ABC transporter, ATP-binding protein n=1 Tax=Sumerlaea chitinivorans TaxID=2250252 RepID=A0A2Z4Y8M1_SUMC1|nr:ABC transporter, ATP-binding protein [Candidatus Sumerlaea chitinivorans]MCX7963240.1 ABC transporter ATP-binding protein [Candidatus Sumerlaea chitinivorans]GIX44692.1 MAG: ABC transporter [Candidatus Sumerlaea sp.]